MDNLARLLDHLRPTAHLNWSAPYNFHITTKFIGAWPEERVAEVVETLQPLGDRGSISITIGDVGWFPNPHLPRVLWTGVKAGTELGALADDTDAALFRLGVAKETRKYSPHLTLARIKDISVPLAPLRQAVAQLPSLEFGSFTADRFLLYESRPGPSGTIYIRLAEIPFAPR